MGQLNNTCGNTKKVSVVQTLKLLKLFENHRKNILIRAGIVAADITPEEILAVETAHIIPLFLASFKRKINTTT